MHNQPTHSVSTTDVSSVPPTFESTSRVRTRTRSISASSVPHSGSQCTRRRIPRAAAQFGNHYIAHLLHLYFLRSLASRRPVPLLVLLPLPRCLFVLASDHVAVD